MLGVYEYMSEDRTAQNEKYGLNSEFSVQKHKETFINYLEVVIDEQGKVYYAVPSHQEKMIAMLTERNGWTRKQLWDSVPQECWFDVAEWTCGELNAVAVWTDGIMGTPNEKQTMKLWELKQNGIYRGRIR